MAFILIVPLLLLFLIAQQKFAHWRRSALTAAVAWGCLLTSVTEILSLFRLITFKWLLIVWTLITVALSLVYFSMGRRVTNQYANKVDIDKFTKATLVALTLITLAVGLNAVVAAPNNYDSMQYHIARVMHWVQNGSVAHYPTSVLRQLYLNPWAEFVILQLQVLNHGDRLANLVQWGAMIGCMISVSLIAWEMGADVRAQVTAAAISATIPMGLAQASGTQNDYVAAFWLSALAYFSLTFIKEQSWFNTLATGACLGLGLLTKGTSYIFAAPFMAWLIVSTFGRKNVKRYGVIAALAILLNFGYYARNYRYFGSPLGVDRQGFVEGYKFSNDTHTPAAVASNIIRNLSLHLGTPYSALNELTYRGVSFTHKLLGIGLVDPRTTWREEGVIFQIPWRPTNENWAGNPLHLFLIASCVIVLLAQRKKSRRLLQYTAALIAAFLLFCAYLKWQPWHSRLQLPLFVLSAPFVACVLAELKYRALASKAVLALLITAVPVILFNDCRPLIGWSRFVYNGSVFTVPRMAQYFNDSANLREPYMGAARLLKDRGCADIGLVMGASGFEYPLWVLVDGARIRHINTGNQVRFEPCAIVALKPVDTTTISYLEHVYTQQFSSEHIKIYMEER